MTECIVATGEILGIEAVDHLIICQRRFISLNSQGLGF
jgi:DNA repair protein RadC